MLTAKQRQCYDYLKGYAEATGGMAPSVAEVADALAMKSKGAVCRLLDCLEARGRIKRIKHRARAIEVIPEGRPRGAIPVVSYPNATYLVWDVEAKALKPMQRRES